jgi:hypothetical protein
MRNRISVVKEDRIWNLRSQGYCYESIARIVNCSPQLTQVIRRVRNRPPKHLDPLRRGRIRGWLSDAQVDDIRVRHERGETYFSIGKRYDMSEKAICLICNYKTYTEPESKYPFRFPNRLMISRRD